jgi:hypothetical protein
VSVIVTADVETLKVFPAAMTIGWPDQVPNHQRTAVPAVSMISSPTIPVHAVPPVFVQLMADPLGPLVLPPDAVANVIAVPPVV